MPRLCSTFRITEAKIRRGFVFGRGHSSRGHPGRNIDVVAHIVVVVLTTHPINDSADDHVAIIAVLETATWLEAGWAAPKQPDVIFVSVQLGNMRTELWAKNVSGPAGMVQ